MKANKQQIRKHNNTPIMMTPKDIEKMQMKSTEHALEVIMGFALLALRDKYGFGKVRLRRFYKQFESITQAYNDGIITLPEIWDVLEKETGLTFSEAKSGLLKETDKK